MLGWRVDLVTQEHGIIRPAPGAGSLPLGTRIRILPNHACMTAAAHDEYVVVSNGLMIDRWGRCRGW